MQNNPDGNAIISFQIEDLISFVVEWYRVARITEALDDDAFPTRDDDPMINDNAMQRFRQDLTAELLSMEKRPDGTLIFKDRTENED